MTSAALLTLESLSAAATTFIIVFALSATNYDDATDLAFRLHSAGIIALLVAILCVLIRLASGKDAASPDEDQ
jgi:hypothetical protein